MSSLDSHLRGNDVGAGAEAPLTSLDSRLRGNDVGAGAAAPLTSLDSRLCGNDRFGKLFLADRKRPAEGHKASAQRAPGRGEQITLFSVRTVRRRQENPAQRAVARAEAQR